MSLDGRALLTRFPSAPIQVYDVLILAQISDATDPEHGEKKFFDMLPAECFSDTTSTTTHYTAAVFFTVVLVITIAATAPRFLVFPALYEEGYSLLGVFDCMRSGTDKIGGGDGGKRKEDIQTKIIFVFALATGILGVIVSLMFSPTPPGQAIESEQTVSTWTAVFDGDNAFSDTGHPGFGDNLEAEHTAYYLLNDLTNGNWNALHFVSETTANSAYFLSIMSVVIICLSVCMYLFKPNRDGKLGVSTSGQLGNWA